MTEEWKKIEENYSVSNWGRVRNDKLNQLSNLSLNNGYLRTSVSGKIQYVHRLVAKAFIPNIDNLPEVNHKNEIRSDNRVENLEWVTHKDNLNFGSRNEKLGRGHCKSIIATKDGEEYGFRSLKQAAKFLNIKQPNISAALTKNRKVKGYTFRYNEYS